MKRTNPYKILCYSRNGCWCCLYVVTKGKSVTGSKYE